MSKPTRFPNGLATAAKGSTLWNFPMPDPTRYFVFFEDFHDWANDGSDTADRPWVDTFVSVGSASSIAPVADEPFGAVVFTAGSNDNDGAQAQWHTENFTITSGKKTWFKVRFKLSEATQSDFLLGLAVLDTTAIDVAGDGVTDGIFFQKDDGSTTITFQVQKDATTGQLRDTNVGTATTSYMSLGFEFDGVRYVKVFRDDVLVDTVDLTTTLSTYLPNTPLAVTLAYLAGAAGGSTMTVDYVFAAQER